jgi:hypothetical protein
MAKAIAPKTIWIKHAVNYLAKARELLHIEFDVFLFPAPVDRSLNHSRRGDCSNPTACNRPGALFLKGLSFAGGEGIQLKKYPTSMQVQNIENTVVDEANHRTYIIMAPRVLTDGEIYRVIRQEILRRGSPLADGETLTLTVTSRGDRISSLAEPDPQKGLPNPAPNSN